VSGLATEVAFSQSAEAAEEAQDVPRAEAIVADTVDEERTIGGLHFLEFHFRSVGGGMLIMMCLILMLVGLVAASKKWCGGCCWILDCCKPSQRVSQAVHRDVPNNQMSMEMMEMMQPRPSAPPRGAIVTYQPYNALEGGESQWGRPAIMHNEVPMVGWEPIHGVASRRSAAMVPPTTRGLDQILNGVEQSNN